MLGSAVPSLTWMDTTNPTSLGATSYWMDTTNPTDLYSVATISQDASYSASPATHTTLSSSWQDKQFLLKKLLEDETSSAPDLTLFGMMEQQREPVCPVVLQTTVGICLHECEKDMECGQGMKCCFNGCSRTCVQPVQVTSTEVCKLPPVSGECADKPYITRVYFNTKTGQCEEFKYRDGCHGNANNFLTTEACVRGCKDGLPDRCLVNPEPGLCKGYFPMWFYNVTSNQCEQFVYGGCQGNRNKFSTEKQCSLSCGPKDVVPTACKSLMCSDSTVCVAYNKTYAECISKMRVLPDRDSYVPDCVDGQYSVEQCSGTTCWCVNPDTGNYVKDTLRIGHAPCTSSDGDLTASYKPVCQNGNTPSPCLEACKQSSCHGNPNAICLPDPCNNCAVMYVDMNRNPVQCDRDGPGPTVGRCMNKKPDHGNNDGYTACGNPQMRYVYNPNTLSCEGFLFSRCQGNDVYFKSYFDCQEQCTGSMCPDSQQKTCDNTCMAAECPRLIGAKCQVNLCSCQPEFFDPITKQKVDCYTVAPLCQLQRTVVYNQWMDRNTKSKMIPVCDEDGEFVPQQCTRYWDNQSYVFRTVCWCVDEMGHPAPNSKQRVSSSKQDIGCKRNVTKSAIVSCIFHEDYDTHVKGKEGQLKRLIFSQLKKLSSVFEKLIKKIIVSRGSIQVDVELEGSSSEASQQVASHANLLESEIRNGFTVDMDGTIMTADRDTVDTTMTFQAQSGPEKAAHYDGMSISQGTLIIIIVVICGVLVLIFIILAMYAKRKSGRSKEADLVTVEGNQRASTLYFRNDVCDLNEEGCEHKMSEDQQNKDSDKPEGTEKSVDKQFKIPE